MTFVFKRMVLDDSILDMPIFGKQCSHCRHLWLSGRGPWRMRSICNAFPKGIPFEILRGEFDHTQPHEGDRGIRFEKRDKPL